MPPCGSMSEAPSFAGVLGYRRSRRNILGMQARLVTIRDGELRVVDREDTQQERVELAGAEVELKRGMVEVAAGERSFFLFGYSQVNKIPARARGAGRPGARRRHRPRRRARGRRLRREPRAARGARGPGRPRASVGRAPARGGREAVVGDALSVAADVVRAARELQRGEEGPRRVGDVQRGAERRDRLVVPGPGAVEEPEAEDDAAPSRSAKRAVSRSAASAERRIGATPLSGVSSDTPSWGG